MTASIGQARDEILTLFRTGWLANVTSSSIPVFYPDVPGDIPDSTTNPQPWVRVTVRHNNGSQASLAGENGKRRWSRSGIVFIEIRTPSGTGLSLADDLAKIATGIFEGASTPSHVWFRNVYPEEIGLDGAWFQTNVIAEFTYDEVR